MDEAKKHLDALGACALATTCLHGHTDGHYFTPGWFELVTGAIAVGNYARAHKLLNAWVCHMWSIDIDAHLDSQPTREQSDEVWAAMLAASRCAAEAFVWLEGVLRQGGSP